MEKTRFIEIENVRIEIGVEVGFIDTFFSSANPELGKVKYNTSYSNNSYNYEFGKITDKEILVTDELSNISRATILETNTPVSLMDVVQRFVIEKDDVKKFVINGIDIFHQKKNFYNQFDSQKVEMHISDGKIVEFAPQIDSPIRGMTPKVYVRDEPDKWILHFRILSTAPDHFVVKGCNSLCNGPFPNWVQKLFKSLNLYRPTLYIRERLSQRIPFQSNGSCQILKKSKFSILTTWSLK